MSDDQIFRVALMLGFFVVLPIGLYHRLRANTGEPLDRRQEGWFILLTLRPAGFLFMFSLLAWAIDPGWMAWASLPLPRVVRWTGVGLYALSGGLLLWTFRTLGRNITDTVVTRREHTLVTRGPYRWVRHPFYVSVGLMAAGSTLAAANWFLALTGALFLSLLAIRTLTEEQKLVERFGDAYREYMQETGRFWPTSFPSSSPHTTKPR
jgi:protein-S-isoprenylcysteine O-methyltransferase Ste14